jgi:hypothetical protein
MRAALIAGLLVLSMTATGCMTMIGQGASTATGASPRFIEIRSLGSSTIMDSYKSVTVQEFDASLLGGLLPGGIPADTQAAIILQLRESKLFEGVSTTPGARPGIVIRGRFMDYDAGGSALRAFGIAPNPFLSAQITVIDQDSGRELGVAIVRGTVKSLARTGEGELAAGVAKAVREVLASHHTKPAKEK